MSVLTTKGSVSCRHIFAIAEAAFFEMVKENKSQVMVVR